MKGPVHPRACPEWPFPAGEFKKFQTNYLLVYIVMIMSDWMQVSVLCTLTVGASALNPADFLTPRLYHFHFKLYVSQGF